MDICYSNSDLWSANANIGYQLWSLILARPLYNSQFSLVPWVAVLHRFDCIINWPLAYMDVDLLYHSNKVCDGVYISYWLRILKLQERRYVKLCYNMLKYFDSIGHNNWVTDIRNTLYSNGFGYIWESQNNIRDDKHFLVILNKD